jgi:hypothetical protein
MECTRHYETSEIIYTIDSRKVMVYGEIKYFCAWISETPHINIVFTIVVVDLPPTYGVVLGRDWSLMIGGYIMNGKNCMMLPNKDGTMVRVVIGLISKCRHKHISLDPPRSRTK